RISAATSVSCSSGIFLISLGCCIFSNIKSFSFEMLSRISAAWRHAILIFFWTPARSEDVPETHALPETVPAAGVPHGYMLLLPWLRLPPQTGSHTSSFHSSHHCLQACPILPWCRWHPECRPGSGTPIQCSLLSVLPP